MGFHLAPLTLKYGDLESQNRSSPVNVYKNLKSFSQSVCELETSGNNQNNQNTYVYFR